MADFQRVTIPFRNAGINLASPVDRMPDGKHRVLDNVRPYGNDRTQGRLGSIVEVTGAAGSVHSLFSFNDPIPSPQRFPNSYYTHARLIGAGTSLYEAYLNGIPVLAGVQDTGYSGRPMSFVVASSDFTPRPWVFIGDFAKTRKIGSNGLNYHMGIAPPNFAPTSAIWQPWPPGPDVGESGLPYVYRFRARASAEVNTGCVSNLGPPIRDIDGLSPSSAPGAAIPPSAIFVNLPQAHPDPQCRYIDVFRFGGSLPQWTYIGTMNNTAGDQFVDLFSDEDIAGNPIAEEDDNQPFLTVDQSVVGGCDIATAGTGRGGTLTITSGGTFKAYDATGDNPFYPLGNQISVNGTLFTFYRSPDSTTSVELLEDTPSVSGATFVVTDPEMMHQPLPCMWGPYGGGSSGIFIFAVGDALRPGAIYWTKGNHPESHPGTNVLEVTSASEPMMNGAMYDATPYAFTNRRMFRIYPTFGDTTDFRADEVPNSKGLIGRWGICATPWGIATVSKDGVYLQSGGAPVSLTDDDLYPIFPHESAQETVGAITIDGMTGLADPWALVDMTQPDSLRLAYGDGFLYFDFLDTGGTQRCLVGQFTATGQFIGWISRDTFNPPVPVHYYEEFEDNSSSENLKQILMGTSTGLVTKFGGGADGQNAIVAHVRTRATDAGDPRPRKLWGDVELNLDSSCETLSVKVGFDDFSYLTDLASASINLTGKHRALGDINAGFGQYAYNIGLDIGWSVSAGLPTLYTWTPTWVPKPELTALRTTDWDDAGYPGAKFVQGFRLRADTLNVTRSVEVLSDGRVSQQTFSVLHPIEVTKPYVFTTPFITHLLRLHPLDAQFWRVEGVEWVYEPAPELVDTWITQETTFDLEGYLHVRAIRLAVVGTGTVQIATPTESVGTVTLSVPLTGSYQKTWVPLPANKSRFYKWSLTGGPFRLFVRDVEVLVKQWGSEGPYQVLRPFGDLSRLNGARI